MIVGDNRELLNFVGRMARTTSQMIWGNEYFTTFRAWVTCPNEYGYHKSVFVREGLVVLLEPRDTFWKVLVGDREVWVDHYILELVE